MTVSASRYFIPLGENCQLGAALDFYGYKESSLFKWANISSDKLLKALKNNFQEIYETQFADVFFRPPNGRTGIIGGAQKIVLPRKGGWGSYDDYMAILDQFDAEQNFNTAVIDKERGFTHGIRMNYSQLKEMSKSEIQGKNQEKIEYLKKKTLRTIHDEHKKVIFLRSQRNLNPRIIRNLNQIYESLCTLRPQKSFEYYVITVDQKYLELKTKMNEKIKMVVFDTFSPANNPMLLQYSYPEWKQLFSKLGVPRMSESKKSKYFSGFEDD